MGRIYARKQLRKEKVRIYRRKGNNPDVLDKFEADKDMWISYVLV